MKKSYLLLCLILAIIVATYFFHPAQFQSIVGNESKTKIITNQEDKPSKERIIKKAIVINGESLPALLEEKTGEGFGMTDDLLLTYDSFKETHDETLLKDLSAKDIFRLYLKSLLDSDLETEFHLVRNNDENPISMKDFIGRKNETKISLADIRKQLYPALTGDFVETEKSLGFLTYENPDLHIIEFEKSENGVWKINITVKE